MGCVVAKAGVLLRRGLAAKPDAFQLRVLLVQVRPARLQRKHLAESSHQGCGAWLHLRISTEVCSSLSTPLPVSSDVRSRSPRARVRGIFPARAARLRGERRVDVRRVGSGLAAGGQRHGPRVPGAPAQRVQQTAQPTSISM